MPDEAAAVPSAAAPSAAAPSAAEDAVASASPPVVIIGGGIGGLAAAVALQARGVRCRVFERDESWNQRKGYGLTLSNATALAALGLEDEVRQVNRGCVSDCHWVFDAGGAVLGYFGIAFTKKTHVQRGNLRVPRVVLRRLLLERLQPGTVEWGWRLRRYEEEAAGHAAGASVVTAHLERIDGLNSGDCVGNQSQPESIAVEASVLVGADGVRSACRALKVGDPLRYVGVVVVLGVSNHQHPLLHEQGFYTVDGENRLFTMPYEPLDDTPGVQGAGRHTTMWQLSFALDDEEAARRICSGGGAAVLEEILRRCGAWHTPVPQMLAATEAATVWGTPLFDRAPMPLRKKKATAADSHYAPWHSRVTLMGDAAHCMTPFKGQGANQALADAPLLAKHIVPPLLSGGANLSAALSTYEREMGDRAEAKVKASREAAGVYHSAAAVDPTVYSIEGVDREHLGEFLATLKARGINAECEQLEARAVEVAAELAVAPALRQL